LVGAHNTAYRHDIAAINLAPADDPFAPQLDGDFVVLGCRIEHSGFIGTPE
jgi:hypothetical protein